MALSWIIYPIGHRVYSSGLGGLVVITSTTCRLGGEFQERAISAVQRAGWEVSSTLESYFRKYTRGATTTITTSNPLVCRAGLNCRGLFSQYDVLAGRRILKAISADRRDPASLPSAAGISSVSP